MPKIQGNIEITGTKDDTYYWKVEGRKIKIHINGFSDLHRTFVRCKQCNGAYQSQQILRNHVLKYHYKQPKSSQPKFKDPEPEPVASTSKAAAIAESNRKRKEEKAVKKRKQQYSRTESSDSDFIKSSESSNGDSDDGSGGGVVIVKDGPKKFKELVRNSDYSDEDDGLSEKEMKQWLQQNYSSREKFQDYAYKTYDMRKRDADNLNIKDFIKQWPLYFHPNSGLYDYDFKRKKRKQKDLMEVWPDMVNKILSFSGGETGTKSTLGISLNLRLTKEQKETLSLMILPNIIRSLKSRNSVEYSSNSDSRNCFFRVVPHDANLAKKMAVKTTKKFPEQPFILLTGKLATMEFFSYNVVMDGHVIKCKDFLQAVDCCFKCYWIFDCEYPIEAEQIWIFLGSIIYCMDDEEKRLLPSTTKILSQFFS